MPQPFLSCGSVEKDPEVPPAIGLEGHLAEFAPVDLLGSQHRSNFDAIDRKLEQDCACQPAARVEKIIGQVTSMDHQAIGAVLSSQRKPVEGILLALDRPAIGQAFKEGIWGCVDQSIVHNIGCFSLLQQAA